MLPCLQFPLPDLAFSPCITLMLSPKGVVMELTIDMPMIRHCDASECSYNLQSACHAKAITIGDETTPACDTFLNATGHVKNATIRAGVGACKVAGCNYNADFECSAQSISVSHSGGQSLCMTYMSRR